MIFLNPHISPPSRLLYQISRWFQVHEHTEALTVANSNLPTEGLAEKKIQLN